MAQKTLRPYQQAAIDSLFKWLFENAGHPLVVAPVGSGKSLLIAEFVRRVHADYPRTRIVVLTHVMELLSQNAEELKAHYPDCDFGFYSASMGQKRLHNDVTFASIQSVYKKIAAFNRCPEILIVDECHLISHNDATTYRKFIESVLKINPNARVIGFTGTPFRSDTGRLEEGDGKLFDGIAYEISMSYMIEQGYWSRPKTPDIQTKMDVTGVATRAGDYIAGQLEKAVDIDSVTQACVDEILLYGSVRKKTLVFTAGVLHCQHVRDAIRAKGHRAEMVTGETDKQERLDIIEAYRRGEFKYLVNVAVLTTGFNVPDIDCLAFMRPTKSPVLYIQTTGRGVRPIYADGFDLSTKEGRLAAIEASDKKDCLILDFGGVVKNLGPIDAVKITKKFVEKDPDAEPGKAIMKLCPSCGAECAAAQRYCFNCSYSFIEESLNPTAGKGAVMSDDIPPEWYKVMTLNTHIHRKKDDEFAKPTMCVTYGTISGAFKEWVCFEHTGYAYDKAKHWYKTHSPSSTSMPKSVALACQEKYLIPVKIAVKKDGKYWRIVEKKFFDDSPVEYEPVKFIKDEWLENNDIPC